ncbi:uncharacterized protein LOC118657032 isoform X4 [Myotis myotis]|uniref:uncharacterized protein LOC118657032 isoform X4 n=1 Tax=Myotis myotis TaxID=51298 RepID=UPI00174D32D6|nr:uncharacterized protein LOC118657032 isoform X4 [Myotis myotis]
MVAGTAEPRPGRKRDGRRAPPSPPLGSAGRPAAPSPRRAQRRRAAPSPAPPLPTGRRRARSPAGRTSGPSLRAGSRAPRGAGLARSFWLGGTRFCQRGKVKVLGIRETRRIYSVTSLDPGRTSRISDMMLNGTVKVNTLAVMAVSGESIQSFTIKTAGVGRKLKQTKAKSRSKGSENANVKNIAGKSAW